MIQNLRRADQAYSGTLHKFWHATGGQAGDSVDGGGAPFPAVQGPDPAGDAEGVGGMREGQPGRDRGGLEVAVLLAAELAVSGGDVLPGQVLDLGIQGGPVLLHDQDVMRLLLLDQEAGVAALGMHRIRRHHAPGQVQGLQQRRELGDLIRLAIHVRLGEHTAPACWSAAASSCKACPSLLAWRASRTDFPSTATALRCWPRPSPWSGARSCASSQDPTAASSAAASTASRTRRMVAS